MEQKKGPSSEQKWGAFILKEKEKGTRWAKTTDTYYFALAGYSGHSDLLLSTQFLKHFQLT